MVQFVQKLLSGLKNKDSKKLPMKKQQQKHNVMLIMKIQALRGLSTKKLPRMTLSALPQKRKMKSMK